MLLPDSTVLNVAIDWLGHGLWDLTWWQVVLYTLVTTHITIAAVTIFLHRTQTHRAMDLGAIPSGQQWSHHEDAGPHAANQFVRGVSGERFIFRNQNTRAFAFDFFPKRHQKF